MSIRACGVAGVNRHPTAAAGRRTLPSRPARRHDAMTAADTDAEARTTLTVVSDFI